VAARACSVWGLAGGGALEYAADPAVYFCFAFAASQSFFDISKKPWPLQEFWPLQELAAVLQAEVPLHEFTPSHFTFASSALAVLIVAVAKTNAAAEARAIPDSFFVVMIISFLVERQNGSFWPTKALGPRDYTERGSDWMQLGSDAPFPKA